MPPFLFEPPFQRSGPPDQISVNKTVLRSLAEMETASAISTSSSASPGGFRASLRSSIASRKASACRTKGDGSASNARTSERPSL